MVAGSACRFEPSATPDATGATDAVVQGDAGDANTATPDWWSTAFAYRAPITVTATTAAVDSTYSVMFTVDTHALVQAGKATSTGDDWRVVRHTGPDQWQELDRWIDDADGSGWNGTDTQTWFAVPVAVAANASDGETYVYYGAPAATNPPHDLDAVFLFGDDFETGLGKWTANNIGEQISADTEHAGGVASFKVVTGGGAGAGVHHDLDLPATTMMWSEHLRQAQTNQSFGAARSFDVAFAGRTPATFVDSHLRLATELDSSDKMQIWTNPLDNWSPPVPKNEWHQVDTVFDGATNSIIARYDGGAWHKPPANATYDYLQGTPSHSIGLEGEGGQNGTFWVDNYVIRRFVDPEPTTALGAEQALPE